MHKPVAVNEILKAFENEELNIFLDCTVGMGGHASHILKSHDEITKYIALDQDDNALLLAKNKLNEFNDKVIFIKSNFSNVDEALAKLKIKKINGCLLDLGVSSLQLDDPERGFSFLREGPLDMRMDKTSELTAYEIVNNYSKEKLEKIFKELGEEWQYKKAAEIILKERKKREIKTTTHLANILKQGLKRTRKHHPATLIFQALRIYVNDELNSVKNFVSKIVGYLQENARIVIITFHSLEDRLVKYIFRDSEDLSVINKKVIRPTRVEIIKNKRSRSAKIRIAEKICF